MELTNILLKKGTQLMLKHSVVLIGLSLLFACQPEESRIKGEDKIPAMQDRSAQARVLCERLAEIKTMPFKTEEVSDEVYTGLTKLKEEADLPPKIRPLVNTTFSPGKSPWSKSDRVVKIVYRSNARGEFLAPALNCKKRIQSGFY